VIYRFDVFELDCSQYRLLRDQTPLRVKPGVLELLAYLIEERERVVSKQELFAKLWSDRYVSDSVLTVAIYEARRALGDGKRSATFIKTVHGRGYQFHFRPVQVVAPPARSAAAAGYLLWAGGPTALREGESGIGRDPTGAVVLDTLRASRHHARIVVAGNAAVLEDLASKNGTLLNGFPLLAPTPLSDGDVIKIGPVELTFRAELANLSTATQGSDAWL
jgi:DNA-binding winged helix-turn-helix (wHTH) protein